MAEYGTRITNTALIKEYTLMEFARLNFTEDGTPRSTQFDDVYFSQGHGLEETNYVFIQGNQLSERFQQLADNQHFAIAETGFGTGLNFIAAWKAFNELAPASTRLTFVSCEKFPLQRDALAQVYEKWTNLTEFTHPILAQYPPAFEGYHLLEFGRVRLLLMLGDAAQGYSQLSAKIDAWFLDGFAPSKNPDMWQPELFHHINRLSHSGTTAATFTAARLVRDGLSGSGFALQKVKGYGKKRHMLIAKFQGIHGPLRPVGWPNPAMPAPPPNQRKRIAIIGAGIAGVSTAIELQQRGYQVELFERAPKAATDGSGNRQGAVYAKLSAHTTVANRFYAQALVLAQRLLQQLPAEVPHQSCGLVQLANTEKEAKKLNDFAATGFFPNDFVRALSAEEASQLLGISVEHSGLWFDNGGWVSPVALIDVLIQENRLNCHYNTDIQHLDYADNQWRLSTATKQWLFDQVILCNAFHSNRFAATQHLPLNPISGQTTQMQATQSHQQLKAVLCTDRYVMPAFDDQLTIGSTFRVKSTDTTLSDEDHQQNISALRQQVPQLLSDHENIVGGHCGLRTNTPDYLPLLGAVADPEKLDRQFRLPVQRNRLEREPAARYLPGLWINAGHGSKGLSSSQLTAKLLASMISGEPLPVPADVLQALNPNRFVIRNLLRDKRSK
jgi:tRNA 5-methylaminomethyl-2-thiouridine biosynthesis bifunctional protein